MWEIAQPRKKKFKLFFQGPPGAFKTRVALRLANNGDHTNPAAAVIDTEFGTDHYASEFAFRRLQENDPAVIHKEVTKLVKNPGNIRTLIFDSFSVYYDALMEKWVDLFQLREKTSAGNKGEYYTLQPRDYVHINRDAAKLVRMLLKCDLNIILNCQVKEKWEGMKVVGSIFDGWKRLPYYFDTVVEVEPVKDGWSAKILGKDRSYSFKVGEALPWKNDKAICDYMIAKMGQGLSGGELAEAYDPDAVAVATDTKPADTKQADTKAVDTKAADVKEAAKEDAKSGEAKDEPKATDQDAKVESKTDDKAADVKADVKADAPAKDQEDTSGKVTIDKLKEIAMEKKKAKINDPAVWAKLLTKYDVTTAKDMTMGQADELIKDLIRGEIPTIGNTAT